MIVTLIGSGNVATVLGRRIVKAGHAIDQVYSRDTFNANKLAEEIGAEAITNLAQIGDASHLYIISVTDTVLQQIHHELRLGDRLIVHTAGTVPMDILKNISSNYGILYPLQTIRKELPDLAELPILIDANNESNRSRLISFAHSISPIAEFANDEQRSKLHLAAVVVNNFSNYLFTLAEDYCKKEGVDFHLLLPLLHETLNRLHHASPASVQTGPAARKDEVTIQKHLQMLEGYPELREAYEVLSKGIGGGEKR